jgi:hypothetical protein
LARFGAGDVGRDAQFDETRAKSKNSFTAFINYLDVDLVPVNAELFERDPDGFLAGLGAHFN